MKYLLQRTEKKTVIVYQILQIEVTKLTVKSSLSAKCFSFYAKTVLAKKKKKSLVLLQQTVATLGVIIIIITITKQ